MLEYYMELRFARTVLQNGTNSNVQDLPQLNQPECEANQALLDLKPVAEQAPASAGGRH